MHFRDRSLNMGRGGGASEVRPLHKMGGGAAKVEAMLKGCHSFSH